MFPPRCVFCGDILDLREDEAVRQTPEGRRFFTEIPLCGACQDALAQETFSGCRYCGTFFDTGYFSENRCRYCDRQELFFDRVIPFGKYVNDLRDVVLEMKKRGREPLARAMGMLMFRYRGGMLQRLKADVVIPMPMHWFYRRVRGINSPEILAETLAEKLGLPVDAAQVGCRRTTLSQRSVPMEKRWANVEGVFVARSRNTMGKRALIVDDVLTTGATCNALARLLKKELGFSFVAVAILARAKGKTNA